MLKEKKNNDKIIFFTNKQKNKGLSQIELSYKSFSTNITSHNILMKFNQAFENNNQYADKRKLRNSKTFFFI